MDIPSWPVVIIGPAIGLAFVWAALTYFPLGSGPFTRLDAV